jgi:hypothetical protein
MVVTLEIVYQGLLLSSVFLFAISLPKILLITGWSFYRTYVYERLLTKKAVSRFISKDFIEKTTTPDHKYSSLANEAAKLAVELKRPGIEMLSALFFMWFSSIQLTVEGDASSLLRTLMWVMVLVGLLSYGHFASIALRLRKIKGGVFV